MNSSKVRLIAALILGWALLGSTPLRAQTDATHVLLQKAQSLERQGRMDLASKVWQQVLLADPKNAEALDGLNRYQREAAAPRPADAPKAQVTANPKPREQAAGTQRTLSAPDKVKLTQAAALAAQRDAEGAMKLYKEVFGERPPDGDWAVAYYETLAATPDGATSSIAALRALTKRYPDDTRYTISLARLLTYNPGQRSEGIKLLQSIPGTDVQASVVRASWRQALVWEKGNPEYAGLLRDYLNRYPDPDLEKEFGPVRAVKSATELSNGQDEQAAYQALSDNNVPRAEQLFEKMRATPSGAVAGLTGLGFVRMKQQDFSGAVSAFEEAKSRSPGANRALDDGLSTARFWRAMQDGTQNLGQDNLTAALAGYEQALAIQPINPDALGGRAGTLMKQGQAALAVPVFHKWTQVSPENQQAWIGLLQALEISGDSAGTIATAKEMPAQVRIASLEEPEFLLPLSQAYHKIGNATESERLLQQALQSATSVKATPDTQARLASALTDAGDFQQATEIYSNLLRQDSQKVEIWEGLIATLHQGNRDTDAIAVRSKMPVDLYGQALERVDFVTMMASIYEDQNELPIAHQLLDQAMKNGVAGGPGAPVQLQVQVANLWLKEKQYDKALDLFGQVLRHDPDDVEAWRGELTAYHESHQDSRAIALVQQASEAQRERFAADPDVLAVLAFAHSGLGENETALRLVQQAFVQYQRTRAGLPLDLELQSCWIFLDAGDSASLSAQLKALSARTDLTPAQQQTLADIWATWSLKRADSDATSGEFNEALKILTAARQAFPEDAKIHAAFAGTLMRAGYTRQGFDEFRTWKLAGAEPDDYAAAIGAAMAVREFKTGQTWLEAGLQLFGDNPTLLMAGARLSIARGDYDRASRLYQEALASAPGLANKPSAVPDPQPWNPKSAPAGEPVQTLESLLGSDNGRKGPGASTSVTAGPADELDSLLTRPAAASGRFGSASADGRAGGDISLPSAHSAAEAGPSAGSQSPRDSETPANDPLEWLFKDNTSKPSQPPATSPLLKGANLPPDAPAPYLVAAVEPVGPPEPQVSAVPFSPNARPDADTGAAANSNLFPSASGATAPPAYSLTSRADVQNEIASLKSQLSPFAETEGLLHGRSGQAGFDKLVSQQTNLEASTMLGQGLRMTFLAEPVILDAGTPTGQSTLQLGTAPQGATPGPMGAAGLGGEVQVATQNFGARLGITPDGFPVRNFIGSFQIQPAGGPIQITASRGPVTDTLLSYAGIRDPNSGQIWGGVISNGLSGIGSWGSASSGFYTGGGYQYITGTGVETNSSMNGTIGAYWRVLSRPSGALTIGLNFFGMHYADNLRYFTLGQGGYFSPQEYLLFNVPVHWGGNYRDRFEYSVDASLGSQHFQEDATPYFPLAPVSSGAGVLLGKVGPGPVVSYYSGQISTGPNYSMTVKGYIHFTDKWVLGGFLNLNNTYNYNSQAAGFFMRFQTRPWHAGPNSFSGSLPDWNSMQTLALN